MNYWYAPVLDTGPKTQPVPPELIEAVTAPWRSTTELEAVRAKAKKLAHYDLADAAHRKLQSRKKMEVEDTMQALHEGQGRAAQQLDSAGMDTITAVDSIWSAQLSELREEAELAVKALRERHEEELNDLRLDQVARAHDLGIRPLRRDKDLQHLRRTESALANSNNFRAAAKVKARADQLSAAETTVAYEGWLLRCHTEQERLLARQRRELDGLRKRLDSRLRGVELARDRNLEQLGRKVKVGIARQQQSFAKERQHLEAALGGCLLNTRSTRIGRSLEDSFPTLAQMAGPKTTRGSQAAARPSSAPRSPSTPTHGSSRPGSAYLGPATSSAEPLGHRSILDTAATQGVRFAPTPPREAWAPCSTSSTSSRCSSGVSSPSASSSQRGSSSAGSRSSTASGSAPSSPRSPSSRLGTPSDVAGHAAAEAVARKAGGNAPSSAAVASVITGGTDSTLLTEATLRAMDQAVGGQASAQRWATSSSSFKSNRPYAAGPRAQGGMHS